MGTVAVWAREKGVLLVEKGAVEAGVRAWEVVRVAGARGEGRERQRQHGWRAMVSIKDGLESNAKCRQQRGRDAFSACGNLSALLACFSKS